MLFRSNTLEGVADGLTLTLQKVSASAATVTVASDNTAVKTAINDFVTAFNNVASNLRTNLKYDEANKKAGALQGDSSAVNLQWALRGVINQVTKTPKAKDGGEVSGSIGTHGYQELKADVNKVISDDVGIRINAMQRDDGSWRKNPTTGTTPEVHRQGFAGSLALNQTKDSKFWINYQKTQTRDIPDYGVSFDTITRWNDYNSERERA